jgi:hypothetical protein
MTTPDLPPAEPILDTARLAVWARENPLEDLPFAELVCEAVDNALRDKGDPYWTRENIPRRARDIGYFVARNYYLNPDLLRSESTGPTSETRAELVLTGIDFTEEQILELERLAAPDVEGDNRFGGLSVISTTRGPLETGRRRSSGDTYVYDERGAWPLPYLTNEENFVFEPDGVSLLPEQVAGQV